MEIHRPKPWSNLRELASEVAVIVIGITIALSGEQVIEWAHRRVEVGHAREALRSEIVQNARLALFNVEEERCFAGVWDRAAAWASGGARLQVKTRGGLSSQVTSTWDVVKAGAAAHMPLEERLAYSRFYDAVAAQQWLVETEREITVRAFGLAARTVLTSADAQRLLEDTEQGRLIGGLHSANSARIVREAKALGLEPGPLSAGARGYLAGFCAEVGVAPSPSSS